MTGDKIARCLTPPLTYNTIRIIRICLFNKDTTWLYEHSIELLKSGRWFGSNYLSDKENQRITAHRTPHTFTYIQYI